jgi:hypothetical protein
MKRFTALLLSILFLTACAPAMQEFTMVRMDGKATLPASIDFREETISVALPGGDELSGKYSKFGFLGAAVLTVFSPREALALFGGLNRKGTPGYAVLTDGQGTVMEVVFYTDKDSGIGFAKTGEGGVYRFVY